MIVDENALAHFTLGRTAPTWRTRLGFAQLAAAIVARLHTRPADFQPDPFATETPFVTDSWPRS